MSTEAACSGARLRAKVRLMLASLAAMPAAIVAIYFTPLAVAPYIAASFYVALWAYERRLGVASPITRAMTVFYLGFALSRGWFEDPSWMAWFSPVVYWTLAALIFALLLAGKPFTAFYAGQAGFPPLHRAMSVTWGGLHAAAGLAALLLIPDPGFLYYPLILMASGVLATMWLNFVSMGPAHERQPRFELEGYSFREAVGREDRETFYRIVAEAYRADLQKTLGMSRKLDTEAIIREHRASNAKWQADFLPFLAFAGDRPAGGICIFFDHRERGLPIESEAGLDLGPWRRAGPVAEVGRLGVARRYRMNPVLLKGLFKCVIEAAAERRVHFIFNDSFEFQAGMYRKIGFSGLRDEPYVSPDEHSTGYGLKVLPMMMNLAGMVRMDVQSSTSSDMQGVLAPYVMERFFKQLAVRDMVNVPFFPKHDLEEVRNAKTRNA